MEKFSIAELSDPTKRAVMSNHPNISAFAQAFNAESYSSDPRFLKGCGPYWIKSWEPGQKVVVKRKKAWWGDKIANTHTLLEAFPDEIIFKIIVDPVSAVAALKNEEIDVVDRITPEDFVALQKSEQVNGCYNFFNLDGMVYFCIPVNTREPKLADKRVRKAIAHVIDVDEVIKELYLGYATRICSPVQYNTPDYNKSLKPVPFDIDKAKVLLAEAGWKDSNGNGVVDKVIDGRNTELSLSYYYTAGRESSQQLALLFQDNAKKAGIEIKPQALEGSEVLQRWSAHNFELLSAGRSISTIWSPKQNWHTTGDNRSGFGNADTDAIIDQILITFDVQKRRALYHQLQEVIFDEQAEIFLFTPKECIAIHKRFLVKPESSSSGYSLEALKLK